MMGYLILLMLIIVFAHSGNNGHRLIPTIGIYLATMLVVLAFLGVVAGWRNLNYQLLAFSAGFYILPPMLAYYVGTIVRRRRIERDIKLARAQYPSANEANAQKGYQALQAAGVIGPAGHPVLDDDWVDDEDLVRMEKAMGRRSQPGDKRV